MLKLNHKNIIYINLEKDLDRRLSVEKQFKKYKVSGKRFPAIHDKFDNYCHDWRSVCQTESYNRDLAKKVSSDKISTAEIGCLLSHLEVIRNFGNSDLLVFEDDVDISTLDFWQFRFSEIIDSIPKNTEILQMFKSTAKHPISILPHAVAAEEDEMWGSVAYFVKASFCKALVESFYVNGKWKISEMPSLGARPVADSIIYSFGKSYTVTLFSIIDFKSSISQRLETDGEKIYKDIVSQELSLSNIFGLPI